MEIFKKNQNKSESIVRFILSLFLIPTLLVVGAPDYLLFYV